MMPHLLKPPPLNTGDTIAIISPAGTVEPSQLQEAINKLEALGYRVVLGNSVYNNKGYLAGTDRERLDDLHWAFESGEVNGIICARGGYGSTRILDGLDSSLVRNNPKILVGYSDITALLLAMNRLCGMVVFHGPMASDLYNKDEGNAEWLLRVMGDPAPLSLELKGCPILRPGRVRGKVLGGNLSLICHLIGTPFMPSFEEAILVVEDRGEVPYRIDRMLTHLLQSRSLDGVKAILMGDFSGCGSREEIEALFLEVARRLDLVLVSGIPVGHGPRNMTFPMGIEAELDTNEGVLRFMEPHLSVD